MSHSYRPTATLQYSIDVSCPKCHRANDLVNQDDDCTISQAIFNNNWHNLKGLEVYCNYCEYEFEINEVIY